MRGKPSRQRSGHRVDPADFVGVLNKLHRLGEIQILEGLEVDAAAAALFLLSPLGHPPAVTLRSRSGLFSFASRRHLRAPRTAFTLPSFSDSVHSPGLLRELQ